MTLCTGLDGGSWWVVLDGIPWNAIKLLIYPGLEEEVMGRSQDGLKVA